MRIQRILRAALDETILEDHFRGKKHRKMQEQHGKGVSSVSRTLKVTNFPRIPYIQNELWAYFERYGPVEDVYVDFRRMNYAFVTFKKPGSAHTAHQQKKHWLGDHLLTVTFKDHVEKPKDDVAALKKKEDTSSTAAADPDEMNQKLLDECDSLDAQIEHLVKEMAMSEEDQELRNSVVDTLGTLFSSYFPGCTLHQFGSSVNGFGNVNSDMDIFLDLNLDKNIEKEQASRQPLAYPYVKHIDSFRDMKGSFMSRDELAKVPVLDKAKLIAKILTSAGKGVSEVLTIPSNRCPLVRFVHNPTGKKVDLSLNNRIAIVNTRLIQFYSELDERFRPLMHVIRYWAKSKEISGNISAGPRLTNYALTLLVIFYLQNIKPAVFPTVEGLAGLSDEKGRTVIDVWDCTLVTDKAKVPEATNTMTINELMTGFFKFFSEFDFVNNVVCPRTGIAVPLARMSTMITGSALANFRIGPMCIQDPFVLEHNTALNVNERISKMIYEEFHVGYQKCKNQSFSVKSEMQSWGLPYLFSKENIEVNVPKAPTKTAECSIQIPMTFGTCPKLFTIAAQQGLDLNESWCMYVCKAVKFTLEKVLCADVKTYVDKTLSSLTIDINTDGNDKPKDGAVSSETDIADTAPEEGEIQKDEQENGVDPGSKRGANALAESDAKKIKTTEEQSASEAPSVGGLDDAEDTVDASLADQMEEWNASDELLMVLHASVKNKVWTDRKSFSSKVSKRGVSPLTFEAKITEKIRDSGEYKMWTPIKFSVEMYKEMNPCQVTIFFKLESLEMKGDFNMLYTFMKQFVPKVLANV